MANIKTTKHVETGQQLDTMAKSELMPSFDTGPQSDDQKRPSKMNQASTSLSSIRTAPNALWYRIHVLIYDLRHFADSEKSRARLELVTEPSYIGRPYFNDTEASIVRSIVVDESNTRDLATVIAETLQEKLSRRKRVEASDYRPCTAHDLAPIFERTFGVKHKDLAKDKAFVKLMGKYGLDLPNTEQWNPGGPRAKMGRGSQASERGGK